MYQILLKTGAVDLGTSVARSIVGGYGIALLAKNMDEVEREAFCPRMILAGLITWLALTRFRKTASATTFRRPAVP
jgi:hypothetical protein